jgi:hypothetical protein
MPVPLGKLDGKLLQAGHPPGDQSLLVALGHLEFLAEDTLEFLF